MIFINVYVILNKLGRKYDNKAHRKWGYIYIGAKQVHVCIVTSI